MSGDDGGELRVPDGQLDYDEELRYYHRGRLFTGVGFEDVPGVGLSEIRYRDGLQDGWSRDWYPSGVLKAETHFRRNVMHGPQREFREDGSLHTAESYEYGVLTRRSTYDASGGEQSRFVLSEHDPAYKHLQHLRAGGWPD